MSTGSSDDLQADLNKSDPNTIDDYADTAKPHSFATDWELDEVTGLVKNTAGPHCPNTSIQVEMQFSGENPDFSAIKAIEDRYTVKTADNCSLSGKNPPKLNFVVDSNAPASTGNVIGIKFDGLFPTATGVGVEHQVQFEIVVYDVTCDNASYDSANDEVDITYTITCGSSDYEVDLYRDNDSSPTLAAQQTKSSTGQYVITDPNPNSGGNSDEYRVDVTDASGGGSLVSCTITVNFPT